MAKEYNVLLKEHIIHTLTGSKSVNLKEYVHQLIEQNEDARDEISKAYHQINDELLGTSDV